MAGERTVKIKIVGENNAKNAFGNAEKDAGGLSSKLGDVGKIAGGFVVGKALTDLPGKMMDMVGAAQEDEAAMIRLIEAVNNADGSYEDYAGTVDDVIQAARGKGFDDTTTSKALASLVATTGDTEEAMERLALAQDLARGTGMDLETASKLLGRVNDENISVLSRYGIQVEKGASAQELLNSVDAKFGGQAAAFAETGAGKYAIAADKVGEMQERIGYALMPVLTTLMEVVGDVAERMQGWVDVIDTRIMPALQPFIDFVRDNIRPILAGLAAVLLAVVVPAFVAWAIAAGSAALATMIALAPIIAVIAGIGIAAALLYKAWETNFFGIRDIVQGVIDFVRPYIETAIGGILSFFQTAWPIVSGLVKTAFGVIQTVIETVIGIVKPIVETYISGLQKIFETVWPIISGLVETAFGVIQTVIETIIGIVGPLVEETIGGFQALFEEVWPIISAVVETAFDVIQTVVETVTETIKTVIATAISLIQGNWDTVWGAIKTTAETVWGGIETAVGVITTIRDTIARVIGNIQTKWDEIWGAIKGTVVSIWNGASGIFQTISTAIGKVKRTVEEIIDDVKAKWDEIWDDILKKVKGIWTGAGSIVQTVSDGIGDVLQFFIELPGDILEKIGDLSTLLVDVGKDILKGLAKGIRDNVDDIVGSAIGFVTDKIPDWAKGPLGIKSPSTVFMEIGKYLMQGMAAGIESGSEDVNLKLTKIAQGIIDVMSAGLGFATQANAFQSSGGTLPSFQFITDLKFMSEHAVRSMGDTAALFDGEFLEHTSTVSSAIKDTLGVFTEAVNFLRGAEGFNIDLIEAWSSNVETKLTSFITYLTDSFMWIAGRFDTEALTAAAEAARPITAIFEPFQKAMDFIRGAQGFSISDMDVWTSELETSLTAFIDNMTAIFIRLGQRFSTEGLDAASSFAAAVKPIFDVIRPVVDSIAALVKMSEVSDDNIGVFESNIHKVVAAIGRLRGLAFAGMTDAKIFRELMEEISGALQAGTAVFGSSGMASVSAAAAMPAPVSSSSNSGGGASSDPVPTRGNPVHMHIEIGGREVDSYIIDTVNRHSRRTF